MEVTCDRCGAEYEFDETLISLGGTTVKCTECGHLFKVRRADATAEPPADSNDQEAAPSGWTARAAGTTEHLESLAELTRRIEQGHFDSNVEISRGGRAWRRLGDIPELQSFFPSKSQRPPELGIQASLPKGVGSTRPARPRRTTTSGMPAPPGDARTKPARRPSRPGPVSAPPPPVRVRSDPPEPEALSPSNATPIPPPPRLPKLDGKTSPVPPRPPTPAKATASQPAPSTPQATATTAAPVAATGQRRSGGRPLAIVAVLSLVLGGGLLWSMQGVENTAPPGKKSAAAFVENADAALAAHHPRRFEEALTEYTKALAFHEVDPNILSSISRVHAVWSQYLRFERQTLAHAGSLDVARLGSLGEQQRQHADAAKRHAQTAARKNPGSSVAEVALADALRLTGNLVGARNELDRARANDTEADAETLRVSALLAIAEHGGTLAEGRQHAQAATAADPSMLRVRVLLCRILASIGDLEGARRELESIRSVESAHPVIEQLQTALRPAVEPPPPDAGTPAASEQPGPEAAKGGNAVALTMRAERLLDAGRVQAAHALLKRARELQPRYARARVGLGYVALEQGNARAAISHFRPAASSGSAEALIGLGEAYRKLGRKRDALGAYERYTRRHPLGNRLSIAQRQIELLSDQLEP